jgi:glycosyltransferase involved in cell wall biosynthesis
VTRQRIPDSVLDAAHARARARAAAEWDEADRLRSQIEAAGWRVVDSGTDFALSPAIAPTVEEGRYISYGSSGAVPSRLDDAPVGTASVIIVAPPRASDIESILAAIVDHGPDATQVVIVADGATSAEREALEALDARDPGGPGVGTEVVATTSPLGHAGALNAGIRRAAAPAVVVVDAFALATGDFITPLVAALDDPSVAVAGADGVTSADLERFARVDRAPGDVDAVTGPCLAFRRGDFVARGPLDERFRTPAYLDVWWSLVLRDGAGEVAGLVPAANAPDAPAHRNRRAVVVADLPITEGTPSGIARPGGSASEQDRLAKRNFYRLLDRFRRRRDLARAAEPSLDRRDRRDPA